MQRLDLSSRYMFVDRIGNEKVTVYFQLIARKYRISNNLLQDTKNFPTGQISGQPLPMSSSGVICSGI